MSGHRPRRIDRDFAERLLRDAAAGRHAGDDPLADVLAAATSPGRPDELAGEAAALAAFRAARLRPVPQPRKEKPSMIKTMLAKLLTLKALAAGAAVATVSVGGVALASHSGAVPGGTLGSAVQSTVSGAPSTTNVTALASPSRPMPALFGLCRAYFAGEKSEHGKALDSLAFKDLIIAAGGKNKVPEFCAKLPSTSAGHPSDMDDPTTSAHPTTIAPTSTTHPGNTDHPTSTTHPGNTDHPTSTTHPGNTGHPTP